MNNEQWIDVIHKLPNQDEPVLVIDKWGYMSVCAYKDKWYPKIDGNHPNCMSDSIVSWMSLPSAPGELTVSSAGKEVRSLQDEEIIKMTKQYRHSVDSHAGATGFYAGAMKVKRWYAEQFKSYPSSTKLPNISDNDIYLQAVKLYPLGTSNYGEREAWISGFKSCRDQMKREQIWD